MGVTSAQLGTAHSLKVSWYLSPCVESLPLQHSSVMHFSHDQLCRKPNDIATPAWQKLAAHCLSYISAAARLQGTALYCARRAYVCNSSQPRIEVLDQLQVAVFGQLQSDIDTFGQMQVAFDIYDRLKRSGLELTLHSFHTALKGSSYLKAAGIQELYSQMRNRPDLHLKDRTFAYVFRAVASCGGSFPASWIIQVQSASLFLFSSVVHLCMICYMCLCVCEYTYMDRHTDTRLIYGAISLLEVLALVDIICQSYVLSNLLHRRLALHIFHQNWCWVQFCFGIAAVHRIVSFATLHESHELDDCYASTV